MGCYVECEMIRIVGDDTYQSSKKKVELFLSNKYTTGSKCLAGGKCCSCPLLDTSFITSLDNDDDHSYNGETMRRAECGSTGMLLA